MATELTIFVAIHGRPSLVWFLLKNKLQILDKAWLTINEFDHGHVLFSHMFDLFMYRTTWIFPRKKCFRLYNLEQFYKDKQKIKTWTVRDRINRTFFFKKERL